MRKVYFLILSLIIQFAPAQNDTLYLFIEKPFFQYQSLNLGEISELISYP
jgi:hypothetical protein